MARNRRVCSSAHRILFGWTSPRHTWPTDAEYGIADARLVLDSESCCDGELVVIGYSASYQNPSQCRGAMCGFDLGESFETPTWRARITEEDLTGLNSVRQLTAKEFGVAWIEVMDVFPDPDESVQEIVAGYEHALYSPRALRIYDLRGAVLYHAWQDRIDIGLYKRRLEGANTQVGGSAEQYGWCGPSNKSFVFGGGRQVYVGVRLNLDKIFY